MLIAERLPRQSLLDRGRVFGKSSAAGAKHLVTGVELRHAGADRHNLSGDIVAGNPPFRVLSTHHSEE